MLIGLQEHYTVPVCNQLLAELAKLILTLNHSELRLGRAAHLLKNLTGVSQRVFHLILE